MKLDTLTNKDIDELLHYYYDSQRSIVDKAFRQLKGVKLDVAKIHRQGFEDGYLSLESYVRLLKRLTL